ncbi:MAG: hypothetical protein CME26_08210 [Gemmatimonadetes bacterium]|nr:hypothetical protein [Gemmatimonadota bacterium]|tara:strand:- start:9556 stop:10197 length:642 start_codon:yes stop_codon:yes gene_type:complete
MPRYANFVEEIVAEVSGGLKDAENNIRREWHWAKNEWTARTSSDLRSASSKFRDVPNRVSDIATDGGCLMRYMFAYSIKGFAALMGLSGVIAIIAGVSKGKTDGITIGLCLLVFAQGSFWVGHRTQKAADRRVDEKDQNRLLRLARDRGGSLSVIEAATDLRLTVDKTETMLRDLSARGYAEVRVSESGLLVYRFHEIDRADEKPHARSVDEL